MDCKGHTVYGKAQGHLPRMIKTQLLWDGPAKGAAPPTYLFRGEIFPCWYRSAPPEEKNRRVRNPNFSWEKR